MFRFLIPKYSGIWFRTASEAELKREREKVRKEYCSAGRNIRLATQKEGLLRKFDAELSRRAWKGKPYGYPKHREHGWYLRDKDD